MIKFEHFGWLLIVCVVCAAIFTAGMLISVVTQGDVFFNTEGNLYEQSND